MSTKLTDTPDGVLVQTLVSPHLKKRAPRPGVLVPAGDRDGLVAEIVKQAVAARRLVGIEPRPQEPVV